MSHYSVHRETYETAEDALYAIRAKHDHIPSIYAPSENPSGKWEVVFTDKLTAEQRFREAELRWQVSLPPDPFIGAEAPGTEEIDPAKFSYVADAEGISKAWVMVSSVPGSVGMEFTRGHWERMRERFRGGHS